LYLRENLIECLHDKETLENIVNHAVDSTLGGNLYIGWEQRTTFPNLYQKKFYSDIERWFEIMLASGASDVIELPPNLRLEQPNDYRHLRRLVRRSESRRRKLRKLVTHNDWSVVLRPEALALKKFLTRFVEADLQWDEERNLAVFYDQKPRQFEGWSTLIKECSRNLERDGNWFISTIARGDTKDRDLEELWLNEWKKKASACFHGVFEFDGTFQWLYALLRLKLAVQLTEVTSPSVAGKVLI
jgi:inactivated superfamily I helicase